MKKKYDKQKYSKFSNSKLVQGIVKNKTFWIGLSVGIVVILSALFYYMDVRDRQEEEANLQLFPAIFFFEKDSLQKSLEGDGNTTDGFLNISQEFSSTKAGNLSNFYIGYTYLKQGKYDQAIEYLQNFSSSDYLIMARAFSLMGDAYFEKEAIEEAIQFYQKACNYYPNKEFTPFYLIKLAHAYEKNDDKENAFNTYEKILQNYPDLDIKLSQDIKRWEAQLDM